MKKLLFIFFACVTIAGTAQEDAINDIRTHYKIMEELIKACDKTSESTTCSLYNNINITNAGNEPWQVAGTYKKEVQFWYSDNPWKCDECGKDGIHVLKKVISSEQSGLTIIYKEFLFQNGKLVLYFVKILGEKTTEEYRYYYQNDILIEHLESGNTMNGEEAAKRYKEVILQKAKTLQEEFLLGFK